MAKTKRWYAAQVLDVLQNDNPNGDWKIDERFIFVRLDAVVNQFAEQNYFDNWKMAGEGIDEGFITTFDNVEVVDQTDERPSYFIFPSNYAALPNNRGIDGIFPLKFQMDGNNVPVVVIDNTTHHRYSNLHAGIMQGRLSGYPKGRRFYFRECGVKTKYGNMEVRLVVKDSSTFTAEDIYPIPSNFERRVIEDTAKWFMTKREQPTDQVRDKNDQP